MKAFLRKIAPPRVLKHVRAIDNWFHGDEELRYLAMLSDRGKTAVDVGANIGVYTYFMKRFSAHVYAYEPNPDFAAYLRVAYPSGVTIVEAAVSSRSGRARLVMPVEGGREQHELSSLVQDLSAADEIRVFEVETRALDDEDRGHLGLELPPVQQIPPGYDSGCP